MITRAKEGTVVSRRLLSQNLPTDAVKKLVDEIGPRYKDRPGGYTRITRLSQRPTDGARMAHISLV